MRKGSGRSVGDVGFQTPLLRVETVQPQEGSDPDLPGGVLGKTAHEIRPQTPRRRPKVVPTPLGTPEVTALIPGPHPQPIPRVFIDIRDVATRNRLREISVRGVFEKPGVRSDPPRVAGVPQHPRYFGGLPGGKFVEKAQFPGLRVATVNPGSAGDKKPLFVADCRNVTLQQRAELLPSAVVTGDSLAAQQVQIACTISRYALYGVVKQTVGIVLMPFEDPDAVAVVAVQPFPGTDPDESPFVAVQGIDRDMRKPVIRSQMTERDILCGNTLEKHSQTKQATTQTTEQDGKRHKTVVYIDKTITLPALNNIQIYRFFPKKSAGSGQSASFLRKIPAMPTGSTLQQTVLEVFPFSHRPGQTPRPRLPPQTLDPQKRLPPGSNLHNPKE